MGFQQLQGQSLDLLVLEDFQSGAHFSLQLASRSCQSMTLPGKLALRAQSSRGVCLASAELCPQRK